jgi:hypothetical protein
MSFLSPHRIASRVETNKPSLLGGWTGFQSIAYRSPSRLLSPLPTVLALALLFYLV